MYLNIYLGNRPTNKPHLILPDDFILNRTKLNPGIVTNANFSGQIGPRRRSGIVKDEDQPRDSNTISLDEFYDHFEQVYPALV